MIILYLQSFVAFVCNSETNTLTRLAVFRSVKQSVLKLKLTSQLIVVIKVDFVLDDRFLENNVFVRFDVQNIKYSLV
jgi:hypothetical protein